MKITLKQMQVFVLTAKYGSITAAADRCFLSQPAASMSLQQLEQALGVPVFDRIGKRLLLNVKGKALLPKALEIVDRVQALELSVNQEPETLAGEMKIGCSLTIANYILPTYLARFKQQHPAVKLTVTMANTQRIMAQLVSLDLDCALIEGPGIEDPNLVYQPWRDDTMVVIARCGHPLSKKKRIDAAALEDYSWVLREQGSGTAALIELHAFDQFALHVEIILSEFEAIKRYVACSDSLSCISSAALSEGRDEGLCVIPVDELTFSRPLSLVVNKEKYPSPVSEAFQRHLHESKHV